MANKFKVSRDGNSLLSRRVSRRQIEEFRNRGNLFDGDIVHRGGPEGGDVTVLQFLSTPAKAGDNKNQATKVEGKSPEAKVATKPAPKADWKKKLEEDLAKAARKSKSNSAPAKAGEEKPMTNKKAPSAKAGKKGARAPKPEPTSASGGGGGGDEPPTTRPPVGASPTGPLPEPKSPAKSAGKKVKGDDKSPKTATGNGGGNGGQPPNPPSGGGGDEGVDLDIFLWGGMEHDGSISGRVAHSGQVDVNGNIHHHHNVGEAQVSHHVSGPGVPPGWWWSGVAILAALALIALVAMGVWDRVSGPAVAKTTTSTVVKSTPTPAPAPTPKSTPPPTTSGQCPEGLTACIKAVKQGGVSASAAEIACLTQGCD